jgi:ketosteroid isomerase-like protein
MRLPFVVLALLPRLAFAQEAVPDSVRRDIVALEERIGRANFACDYRFFAQVEAAEFIFTDSRGGVTTRAEDLAGESSCKPSKGSYSLEDVRLMAYGDVVVFNALTTTRGTTPKGEPFERKTRFTDVLVRRDAGWRLVAGHSSLVP